ncbi:Putative 3-methyladenine DNA glycosylase [Paraconexibacter sp. AEG42_29]|uniref:Putative 3-methyladenine DNA glycosylase n=1 Tax=Paraconexibacter sp. AEG42_29 TaxID=2997339 RepID=A0AAU7AV21_9ACTN
MTPAPAATLPVAFYDRPVLQVAQDMVGCVVRHGDTAGVILETEAYHDSEAACHAHIGLTPRTQVLLGPPAIAYVYRSYGVHALLNAVCEADGVGAAVLIRALLPLEGIKLMRLRRGAVPDARLCDGPGKLTQALGFDLEPHGTSLVDGPVTCEPRPPEWAGVRLVAGPRIGITKAADLPWRFCAAGARGVSRPWPAGLLDAPASAPAPKRASRPGPG